MKIEMMTVWLITIVSVIAFQNLLTVNKYIYDVSYYAKIDGISVYGDMSLTANDTINNVEARNYIKDDLKKEHHTDNVEVVVLSSGARGSERYFKPFWAK